MALRPNRILLKPALWQGTLAGLLGCLAAVLIQGYVLADFLSARSRWLVLLTGLALVLSAVGYFFLLGWLKEALSRIASRQRPVVYGLAVVVGSFAFFGGTSPWTSGDRNVPTLLPQHQLQLEATPDVPPGSVSLTWFSTTLGDISYDDLHFSGWNRVGDALVLASPASNRISWRGVTGARSQLVLDSQQSGNHVRLGWNGEGEIVSLRRGKNPVERDFAVPFLASSLFLILAGWVTFLVLGGLVVAAVSLKAKNWVPLLRDPGTQPGARGSIDGWVLGTILLLAIALRTPNLGKLYPAVDEYYHLIAAQQLLAGVPLAGVYPRGVWLVTVPVAGALRLFGHELWAARLVGTIFNVAAIIPLYLVTRRINRTVAFLSCGLYALSPWIVTFARVAREYAYYPFYFYWILLGMILLAEAIPSHFRVTSDWRRLLTPRVMILTVLLAVPPIFALKIDWLSTFRTILIAYVVLGAYLLTRLDWHARGNWPVVGLMGLAVVLTAVGLFREQSSKLLVLPRLNTVPLEYFLPNPPQQWYFDRIGIIAVLAILSAAVLAVVGQVKIPAFLVGLFLTYLVVFAFFSKSFFHTRHLLSTELWYIPVIGAGVFALWNLLRTVLPWKGSPSAAILGLLLMALALNPLQIILPAVSSNPDMRISEDYHHDMSAVQQLMLARAAPGDVLVSTVYGLYATWEGSPRFRTQYRITSGTPLSDILAIVGEYPSGWIVIDRIRLDISAITPGELKRYPQIEYIGVFGDEYVWRWMRGTTNAGGLRAN